MDHLSLVFFTLLAQAAAGLMLMTGMTQLVLPAPMRNHPAVGWGYIAALFVFILGMLASTSHLGHPLRAFNVVYGLEHMSALSLEIVAASAFGGALFIVAVLWLFGNGLLLKAFVLLAMVLAVVLVQAIAHVYTLQAVAVWNTWLTPLQFFQSALALGSILAAQLFLTSRKPEPAFVNRARRVVGWTGLVVIVMLVVKTVFTFQHLDALGLISSVTDSHLIGLYRAIALSLTGMLFWIVPALYSRDSRICIFVGLVLIVAGELMGRIYFYDLLNYRVM